MSNEIKNKFDDIDGKIDFVIELCQTLQQENSELMLKIKDLETQLDKKNVVEEEFDRDTGRWVKVGVNVCYWFERVSKINTRKILEKVRGE